MCGLLLDRHDSSGTDAIPAAGQQKPHAVTRGAGHFLQEDKGEEVAQAIAAFIKGTPVA